MSSVRLPRKALKKIGGKFILEKVISRLKFSKKISNIIVATSKHVSDDEIYFFCKKRKIDCFRGSLNNVYLRFFNLIKKKKIKNFVRISGDSPYIDSRIVDKCIKLFDQKKTDIVTNTFPKSFPDGQSVEVINSNIFLKIKKKIKISPHKEHVTKYFYDNSSCFKIINLKNSKNLNYLNLSVNSYKDYKFLNSISKKIKNDNLSLSKIVNIANHILK